MKSYFLGHFTHFVKLAILRAYTRYTHSFWSKIAQNDDPKVVPLGTSI